MVDLVKQMGLAVFYRFPTVGPYAVTSNSDPEIDTLADEFDLFILTNQEEIKMKKLVDRFKVNGRHGILLLYKKQDQINDPVNATYPNGQLELTPFTACDETLTPLHNSIFWDPCDIVDVRDDHMNEIVRFGAGHPNAGQPVLSVFGTNQFHHIKQDSIWYLNKTKSRLEAYWTTHSDIWFRLDVPNVKFGTFDDNANDEFTALGNGGAVATDYYGAANSDSYINAVVNRITWERNNILAPQNGIFGFNLQAKFNLSFQRQIMAAAGKPAQDAMAVDMVEFTGLASTGSYLNASDLRDSINKIRFAVAYGLRLVAVAPINSAAAYGGNTTELAKLKFSYYTAMIAGYSPLLYFRAGSDYAGLYKFQLYEDVKRLGSPTGPGVETSEGVWTRPYKNGSITINASTNSATETYTTLPAPNVNQPPRLAPPASQTFTLGDYVQIPLYFDDPEGTLCAVTVTGLPPGVTYDSSKQMLVGVLSHVGWDKIVWNPTIVIKDNAGVVPYEQISDSFRFEVYPGDALLALEAGGDQVIDNAGVTWLDDNPGHAALISNSSSVSSGIVNGYAATTPQRHPTSVYGTYRYKTAEPYPQYQYDLDLYPALKKRLLFLWIGLFEDATSPGIGTRVVNFLVDGNTFWANADAWVEAGNQKGLAVGRGGLISPGNATLNLTMQRMVGTGRIAAHIFYDVRFVLVAVRVDRIHSPYPVSLGSLLTQTTPLINIRNFYAVQTAIVITVTATVFQRIQSLYAVNLSVIVTAVGIQYNENSIFYPAQGESIISLAFSRLSKTYTLYPVATAIIIVVAILPLQRQPTFYLPVLGITVDLGVSRLVHGHVFHTGVLSQGEALVAALLSCEHTFYVMTVATTYLLTGIQAFDLQPVFHHSTIKVTVLIEAEILPDHPVFYTTTVQILYAIVLQRLELTPGFYQTETNLVVSLITKVFDLTASFYPLTVAYPMLGTDRLTHQSTFYGAVLYDRVPGYLRLKIRVER